MNKPRYSLFHAINQKIASSRPGAWLFSRTLHHFDWLFLKLSGGRITLTSILAGLPVIIITTTGAKSGLPRTLPLICIRDTNKAGVLAIIASNWGQQHAPGWYHNLKTNPHASATLNGKSGSYLASEAAGAEYEKFWQIASETYPGFPLYKERAGRRIPIMVLTPE